MPLGYAARASGTMLRHPWEGLERIRGRIDRRRDRRQLRSLSEPVTGFYRIAPDWQARLHEALAEPWPCPAASSFHGAWTAAVAQLAEAGVHVGMYSFGRWNDGDEAFVEAVSCIVAHLRPHAVVETGVAHGLSSRFILQALENNDQGRLWSIDLPAVDPTLHREAAIAVPETLRHRWTYTEGTSRDRLPSLLARLGEIDVFLHDSLHTGRNQRFELETAWAALRPGGVALVDDVDHSIAFRSFVDEEQPPIWLAALHENGNGLWGLAVKAG